MIDEDYSFRTSDLNYALSPQTQIRRDVSTQPVHAAGDAAQRVRRGPGAAGVQRAVRAADGTRRPADPVHQPSRAAAALQAREPE